MGVREEALQRLIEKELSNRLFKHVSENSKTDAFSRDGAYLYIPKSMEISLVLDPSIVELHPKLLEDSYKDKPYHNTSMKEFESRLNKGNREIKYGYIYKFETVFAFSVFLDRIDYLYHI